MGDDLIPGDAPFELPEDEPRHRLPKIDGGNTLARRIADLRTERDEALRVNAEQGERLRTAQARVAALEGRLYAYADEAHRLSDCLRAYDGGGIPSRDAHKAFGLLHTIEQDVGLKPMDERKAREAAEAACEGDADVPTMR